MAERADIVGERVLQALERGRQRAIERQRRRGAITETLVRRLLDDDLLAARGVRGRAGRIQRALRRSGIDLTERGVRKVLERLSSGSDSIESTDRTSSAELA
jgi:hypothetical protein